MRVRNPLGTHAKPCGGYNPHRELSAPSRRKRGNGIMGLYQKDLPVAALPTFIPLHDAAKKLGMTDARLRSLISAGRMNAVEINGEIVVSEISIKVMTPKEKLPGV